MGAVQPITRGAGMESNHFRRTDYELDQWGFWSRTRTGEVRGYPREVPFYRMMRGSGVRDANIPEDRADQISNAHRRLTDRCPDQGMVIKLKYVEQLSHAKIGKQMGFSETRSRELWRQGVNAIEWILECS